MENKLLKTRSLTKLIVEDGDKRPILKDINFDLSEGEFISIMGPSGCGKTTLLFCLSSLDDFDSGEIFFQEQKLSEINDSEKSALRRKQMGFVFQQPTFLKNLSLLDNIVLSSLKETKNKSLLEEKATALMEKLGISHLAKRSVSNASGGELQRAGICRALINQPKIIFADEPTGALNSNSTNEVMEIFKDINNGGTCVVIVTHDPKVAAKSNRTIFMRDGKLIDELSQTDLSEELKLKSIYDKMADLAI